MEQQIGLDQLLPLQVQLLSLQGQLQGLADAHLGQRLLQAVQHPAELLEGVAQVGQPLGQCLLDVVGGRPQRRFHSLHCLQQVAGIGP